VGDTSVVFLSRSHADRDLVLAIDTVLQEHGAETFLDQEQIEPGDILPEQIRAGIDDATHFLLFWSVSAACSSWVAREWNLAWDLRKRIIPYRIDGVALPAGLDNLFSSKSATGIGLIPICSRRFPVRISQTRFLAGGI
jgi:hypothetical protein